MAQEDCTGMAARMDRIEKLWKEDRDRWKKLERYLRVSEDRWQREWRRNEARWQKNEERWQKTDARIEAMLKVLYRKLEGGEG